jgi:protein PhnA
MEKQVATRAKNSCELCGSEHDLTAFLVSPKTGNSSDDYVYTCGTCAEQLTADTLDENHWRCLNDAMWSEVEAVKVVAYRLLHALKSNGAIWAADLLEMMYLEPETEQWAKEGMGSSDAKHVDSNGVELQTGDSVTLIKDLKVKGGNFTAKRGTAVRNIRLVHDNPEQIEGKVDGQQIVILTQYVLKR